MHALERTCLLALLLSTSAHAEAGIQSTNMAVKNGHLHQQYKDRRPTPAPGSVTEETFTVNALIGQEAVLKCEKTSLTSLIMQTWKTETQSAHNCFMSARFDKIKTFTNCSEHIQWVPSSAGPYTLYINPVGIADDGRYTLDSAILDVGNIYCHITLKVQVSPVVTLMTDGSGDLVCQASVGKPAANISWQPACDDCLPVHLLHHNKTVTVTSKYRARSENETSVMCLVSHPTFAVPLNLSRTVSSLGTGVKDFGIEAWKFAPYLLWLSVAICFIITAAIIGFVFYRKPQVPRQCYKFTCCQEASLQSDQQNPQNSEVVEEVEPYASYMQKVNTIYCSITDMGPYHVIDGSQMELRNIPSKERR